MSYPKIYLYKQIVSAKLYIDNHFKDKIDLGSIANHAYYSKFHFHRIFKECYGKTPHQYLIYLRLKEAKILLSNNYSVKTVCYEVGFDSLSSFIKLFKKHTAQTPAEYAKEVIKKKQELNQHPLQAIPPDFTEYLGWNQV